MIMRTALTGALLLSASTLAATAQTREELMAAHRGGTLKLVSWAGFTDQIGQSFDLLDWESSGGSFASIDASGLRLASGAVLDTSQLYTAGVFSITAVPEPGT